MQEKTSLKKTMIRDGLLVLGLLLLDQLSKWLIRSQLTEGTRLPLLGDFFGLSHVENPGAAWGMLGTPPGSLLLRLASGFLILYLLWVYRRLRQPPLRTLLALLISGSLGNWIDRLSRGSVTDFFSFHLGLWEYPSFNVADSLIVLAALGLFLYCLRRDTAFNDLARALGLQAEEEHAS